MLWTGQRAGDQVFELSGSRAPDVEIVDGVTRMVGVASVACRRALLDGLRFRFLKARTGPGNVGAAPPCACRSGCGPLDHHPNPPLPAIAEQAWPRKFHLLP